MTPALLAFLTTLAAGLAQPAPQSPSEPPTTQPTKAPMPVGHPGMIVGDPTLNWPKARQEDVASVDAIVAAFYAVPGGDPGQARDWDRYRSLFSPDARLIPARGNPQGGAMAMFVTTTDYISLNKAYFEKGGFFDREIGRKVESFGHLAHVWSVFESRRGAADAEPYVRGINSIQLMKDGDRWWIVNVFWDFEGPGAEIPAEYLERDEK